MALIGTSGVSVEGDMANIVHGNQTINYNTHGIVQQKAEEKEPTLYDQFRKIRLGDIYIVQDICYRDDYGQCWLAESQYRTLKFRETISIAKIYCKAAKDLKFTVVSYNGPRAAEKWEEDFRRVARVRGAQTMQLFGINRSSVSRLLIFHGELLPIKHWYVSHICMRYFIGGLVRQWGCDLSEVWLNSQTGVLCAGMPYERDVFSSWPFLYRSFEEAAFENVLLPSSAELLNKDVFVRYLSSLPLDNRIDYQLLAILNEDVQEKAKVSHSHSYTILVRRLAWKLYLGFGSFTYLEQGDLMPNGATRFLFNPSWYGLFTIELGGDWQQQKRAWLCKALSIFHALGVSLEEDLSKYRLRMLWEHPYTLIGKYNVLHERQQKHTPIYLFLLPFDIHDLSLACQRGPTTSLHMWSFDKLGQSHISDGMCQDLGLPTSLTVRSLGTDKVVQGSYPTKVYKRLYSWQVARGFDPTTTDFARHCDLDHCFDFQVDNISQFEELHNESEEPKDVAPLKSKSPLQKVKQEFYFRAECKLKVNEVVKNEK
ncbi:hypothetical protein L218DRAFT_988058 [Marasmius fiardii PR-910]|nr:hypothetical protein L218DRAFT_988058 [Marasmius fiardii PR-910]